MRTFREILEQRVRDEYQQQKKAFASIDVDLLNCCILFAESGKSLFFANDFNNE